MKKKELFVFEKKWKKSKTIVKQMGKNNEKIERFGKKMKKCKQN